MSILNEIKRMLGISEDNQDFDVNLLIHINSALSNLYDVGVFKIPPPEAKGSEDMWDMINIKRSHLFMLKQYVYMSVRLTFDPPETSFAISSMEKIKNELEWRLHKEFDET